MTNTNPEIGKTTKELSEYIQQETYDNLPSDVVDLVRWQILDTVGCILYGSTTPWVQKLVRAVDGLGNTGDATVIGADLSVTPERAALVNGTASHALDYDDYTQEAGLHAGCTIVPPALAFSETTDRTISGKEFLTAIAVGDEVGCRSGYGIGFGSLRGGLHIAGWTGAFASAATTGKLYGLETVEMANALGLGGTQGAGLTGAHAAGADVKRFHMGKAGESGYLGVALAEQGFTGDTLIFEDRHGSIGPTMSDDYNIPAVIDQLGSRYVTGEVLTLKPYPIIGGIHTSVDAVKAIMEENDLTPDDIEDMTIYQNETHKRHIGWEYEPRGVMAAQANIQYAVATFLEDGDVTVDAFTDEAIRRPNVLERVEDIDIEVDDSLEDEKFGTIVELRTTAGDEYTKPLFTPPGMPPNTLSDEKLLSKFENQASKVLSGDNVDNVVDFLLNIEEQEDITELFDYLN